MRIVLQRQGIGTVIDDTMAQDGAAWQLFTETELWSLNQAVSDLAKSFKYFVDNCCTDQINPPRNPAALNLCLDIYEQHVLIADSNINPRNPEAPKIAIEYLQYKIEHLSKPSLTELDLMRQEVCRLAVEVTKPGNRNVHWLTLARDTCIEVCDLIEFEHVPDDAEVLVPSRLCAVRCYEAQADAKSTRLDLPEPLVVSAELLALGRNDPPYVELCQLDEGRLWTQAIAVTLLDNTPYARLVDTLRESVAALSEPLRALVNVMVDSYKNSYTCVVAFEVANGRGDIVGARLWRKTDTAILKLREVMRLHALYLLDNTHRDVHITLNERQQCAERLLLAAHAHEDGENVLSHCYEMASETHIGSRQRVRHAACLNKYLRIIESLPEEDPVLTNLKVDSADRYMDLTDKNMNGRPECALQLHYDAAELRVAAWKAGLYKKSAYLALVQQGYESLTLGANALEGSDGTDKQLMNDILRKVAGIKNGLMKTISSLKL